MATTASELQPIQITAGVQTSDDRSGFATPHWTAATHIRFRDGFPEKIGGWITKQIDYSATIAGKCRRIYGGVVDDKSTYILGTHKNLYSIVASRLTNITPLKTSSVAIANSLYTDYYLGTATIESFVGTRTVVLTTVFYDYYEPLDNITLSGFSALGGIPAGEINATQVIRVVGVGYIEFTVSTTATSSATQTGGSRVVRSGWLRVNATAHGMVDGNRVKLSGAANTGGILAANINKEFIIRNVTTNTFDVMTTGTATSYVAAGGGAGTVYYAQIADGSQDEGSGAGYGMGLYGMGLYGTALAAIGVRNKPRTWFMDRFADAVILTPGNQGAVYTWSGDNTTAPTVLTNSPSAVNYVFVSNNIVITLGANGVGNRIKTSDQGNPTIWTGSSVNQVFEDDIEGAGEFVPTHLPVAGGNLIFTANQTYFMRYIGGNEIWSITKLDGDIGIIAPLAGVVIGGIAYWMDGDNYYMWSGGNIEIIPSNTIPRSTILRYVQKNITSGQRSKVFCWYNDTYNEIWFHYPSALSLEPDRIARVNVVDKTWVPDIMDRTAAEYPNITQTHPLLVSSSGGLYSHEYGTDADTQPLNWSLVSNRRGGGKYNYLLSEVVPDSQQTGNITLAIDTRRYPQSADYMYSTSYTITPTTERVAVTAGGRYWQYTLSGNALGQSWAAGQWFEAVQKGSQN